MGFNKSGWDWFQIIVVSIIVAVVAHRFILLPTQLRRRKVTEARVLDDCWDDDAPGKNSRASTQSGSAAMGRIKGTPSRKQNIETLVRNRCENVAVAAESTCVETKAGGSEKTEEVESIVQSRPGNGDVTPTIIAQGASHDSESNALDANEIKEETTYSEAPGEDSALSSQTSARAQADEEESNAGGVNAAETHVLQTQTMQSPEMPACRLRSHTEHPGMMAFQLWYSSIAYTCKYRFLSIAKDDSNEIEPLLLTRSERGHVSISLQISNATNGPVDAFWIDYRGNEVYKGSSVHGQTFHQTTWIGHPWLFRGTGGTLLAQFIPLRIVPSTTREVTIDDKERPVGIYRFTLNREGGDGQVVCIDDPIFPHPPSKIATVERGVDWACRHLERECFASPAIFGDAFPAKLVLKYLYNICRHPSETKYRRIRVANRTFYNGVWITAGRGVLLALGFEEHGPNVEMGPPDDGVSLSAERLKQVSGAILELERCIRNIEEHVATVLRPNGVDGFGRAGYGRAGNMNL